MVNVKFYKNQFGYYKAIMTGHANYKPGNDIICSAVSALGLALVGTIKNIQGLKTKKCEYKKDIRVIVEQDQKYQSLINAVFTTIFIGLLQIMNSYPKNVAVTEVVEKLEGQP